MCSNSLPRSRSYLSDRFYSNGRDHADVEIKLAGKLSRYVFGGARNRGVGNGVGMDWTTDNADLAEVEGAFIDTVSRFRRLPRRSALWI